MGLSNRSGTAASSKSQRIFLITDVLVIVFFALVVVTQYALIAAHHCQSVLPCKDANFKQAAEVDAKGVSP